MLARKIHIRNQGRGCRDSERKALTKPLTIVSFAFCTAGCSLMEAMVDLAAVFMVLLSDQDFREVRKLGEEIFCFGGQIELEKLQRCRGR
jgi:hypothetical protein